jgi:hypothetical protein
MLDPAVRGVDVDCRLPKSQAQLGDTGPLIIKIVNALPPMQHEVD